MYHTNHILQLMSAYSDERFREYQNSFHSSPIVTKPGHDIGGLEGESFTDMFCFKRMHQLKVWGRYF